MSNATIKDRNDVVYKDDADDHHHHHVNDNQHPKQKKTVQSGKSMHEHIKKLIETQDASEIERRRELTVSEKSIIRTILTYVYKTKNNNTSKCCCYYDHNHYLE